MIIAGVGATSSYRVLSRTPAVNLGASRVFLFELFGRHGRAAHSPMLSRANGAAEMRGAMEPHTTCVGLGRLRAILALTFINFAAFPQVRAADSIFGFGYCAPPVVPSCVENEATFKGNKAIAACDLDMVRFERSLAAYRSCLARETERAILQGNEAISRFRCRTGRKLPSDDVEADSAQTRGPGARRTERTHKGC